MGSYDFKVSEETPTIFGATGREELKLSPEAFKAIDRCDAILRANGMQMRILCEVCHARTPESPYVQGNNSRYGTEFNITCNHAVRRLRFDDTH